MCRCRLVRSRYGLMVFTLIVTTTFAMAGQVTLRWEANVESDLAGYIVYFGTSSGVYEQGMDVGLTSTPQAPEVSRGDLAEGVTYYFAVTAYDVFFNESDFSNEVVKTIADVLDVVLAPALRGCGGGSQAKADRLASQASRSR